MKKGIMISQIEPESRKKKFRTLEVIDESTQDGFFQAIQTVEINDPEERREINLLMKDRNLEMTYCMARILNESDSNLSSLDLSKREFSVNTVNSHIEEALELGAQNISFVAGKRPEDSKKRNDALRSLSDSLIDIGEFIKKSGVPLRIIIEPLDVAAHKKSTLGYTRESIELVENVNQSLGINICFLCLDTAHMLLNHENIFDFQKYNLEFLKEFHFCNCVTDQNQEGFGDHHIPLGEPGVLMQSDINNVWKAIPSRFRTSDLGVFFEVKRVPEWSLTEIVEYNKELFRSIIQ